MLLTPERSLSRKIREWILTPRVEQALTKDQILSLYINQVYYGQGRSGIEEAALYYFGKHAKELTVGEAAVLAGTVQSPNRINPEKNIIKAKQRQRYVLGQMAHQGFASQQVVDAELEKPIVLAPRPPPEVGPYYAEEIRRTLVARYGDEAVLTGGLRVDIAMMPKLQAVADEAVRKGLEAVDRRQGYRGALGTLEPAHFERLKPLITRQIEEAGRRQMLVHETRCGQELDAQLRDLIGDRAEDRFRVALAETPDQQNGFQVGPQVEQVFRMNLPGHDGVGGA